ncbi:hypothetical protein VN97_g12803, partial [Penicillium thymicola]
MHTTTVLAFITLLINGRSFIGVASRDARTEPTGL